MNFGTMSDTELLLTHCRIIDHIRQRELHSPGGNPIAGYAELLASERLDLQLYPDETIGFDAKDRATGETYQIKHTRNPKSTPLTGIINNLDGRPFGFLVFLIFNADLSVREAWRLPYEGTRMLLYDFPGGFHTTPSTAMPGTTMRTTPTTYPSPETSEPNPRSKTSPTGSPSVANTSQQPTDPTTIPPLKRHRLRLP